MKKVRIFYLNKERKNVKYQREITELKSTIGKVENLIEGSNNHLDEMGERISKLEDRAVVFIKIRGVKRKKSGKSLGHH